MPSRRLFLTTTAAAGAASALLPHFAWAADDKSAEQIVTKAIGFLTVKGQSADGSYTAANGPGITGLVVASILRNGRSPDDPAVSKSLKYLEGFVQPDGGIYSKESFHKNYETCICILAFTEANKDGRYDKTLKQADGYIKGIQWDESEQKAKDDVFYGGAGYGKSARPDLSNTSFLIDALRATGNDENSEAIKRALIFVSRCQNLETEHNTTPFAAKNPDGGFYYTPAGTANNSQAGIDEKTGGLRSYASMTYAGLKSMIYAGVKPSDPRVKAALTWLQKHYSLKENPGMGQSGLFYYYNTFAKALAASGHDEFVDEQGVKHDWRKELIAELASRQRDDGSWVNDEKRWMEGDANIVTAYALLALSYCQKK
ncbi:MAG: prenyltransferase/squalene oxidase repeat-containing protein [Pirellulaceae bacterium]